MKNIILLLFPLFLFAQTKQSTEEQFRSIPSAKNLRDYMEHLSARPHHLGSAYDKENAEWLLGKFQEWGWDAHIENFYVLFPTPKERLVELTSPKKFALKLQEPIQPSDPTSKQLKEQLPTYNAYSIDGDVTAPLVYVNYGTPADYEQLDRLGISVKGCIVIARYGASWRGIKPKVAAEHGAVGCIIYSDPKDDGYVEGDVFPKGPMRNSDGVQRGSVMDMPIHPGDPLTPGIGATKNAKRLAMDKVDVFTKIPVLPISYGDAQPLLSELNGPIAPDAWRGGLPITYHIGPGDAKVHLKLVFNWNTVTLYDVIATMTGSDFPDEWIVRGNHHDAWVNGAEDPIAGLVSELEEARAFGELKKQGWKPKRTLVYCAWDGEEQGLLGSTEWVETHAEELKQKAVIYLNTDGNGRGYLHVSGSHSLESFMNSVAKDISDPETHLTVWKRLRAKRILDAASPKDRDEIRNRSDLKIGALGSGSDYTAFVDYLGIASFNMGYGGEDDGGIYHSIYDDFYWFTHFSDTDFVYGRALAQTAGTTVLRLADTELLPFSFTNLSETVKKYIEEIQTLVKNKQDEVKELNAKIDDGIYTATIDPKVKFIPPAKKEILPYINFAPLLNASDKLAQSADGYAKARTSFQSTDKQLVKSVNQKLIQTERSLIDENGLPNRPWFKHQLYAPGFYTGYGVKTIPAVREAIEQDQWKLAEEKIVSVAKVIENTAAVIDAAAAELEKSK
ncbi:MAG: M28 family metallopeptidase [Bacteroidota bacterium]|nr:M28 family metallopeptidase [Bacteroidota bacterium]